MYLPSSKRSRICCHAGFNHMWLTNDCIDWYDYDHTNTRYTKMPGLVSRPIFSRLRWDRDIVEFGQDETETEMLGTRDEMFVLCVSRPSRDRDVSVLGPSLTHSWPTGYDLVCFLLACSPLSYSCPLEKAGKWVAAYWWRCCWVNTVVRNKLIHLLSLRSIV